MKIKLAFIGNSSSTSYYVRSNPPPSGSRSTRRFSDAGGGVLVLPSYWIDRYSKRSQTPYWRSSMTADIVYSGDVSLFTGFEFKAGYAAANPTPASEYSATSFPQADPASAADPIWQLKLYTLDFSDASCPLTEDFVYRFQTNMSGMTTPAKVANTEGLTLSDLPGEGYFSTYCSWNAAAKNLRIFFHHYTHAYKDSGVITLVKDIKLYVTP